VSATPFGDKATTQEHSSEEHPMTKSDYIIVGAGSAGCALASRLSEEPATRVLLLEAGSPDVREDIFVPAAWPLLFRTECNWGYTTAPQPALNGREIYFPRGKTLGGSSSINVQVHLRGHRLDFDEWAGLGNQGWGYEHVLPYFKKSENNERGADVFRGTGGPLNIAERIVRIKAQVDVRSSYQTLPSPPPRPQNFGWPLYGADKAPVKQFLRLLVGQPEGRAG
jgi:choline dehydrogenase-like flavoprotein